VVVVWERYEEVAGRASVSIDVQRPTVGRSQGNGECEERSRSKTSFNLLMVLLINCTIQRNTGKVSLPRVWSRVGESMFSD